LNLSDFIYNASLVNSSGDMKASTSTRPKPRVRLPFILALIPVAVGGLFCWSILRPTDSGQTQEPLANPEIGLLSDLEGIDASNIEAMAVERRSGVIEVGLLLEKIQFEQPDAGHSTFQAGLINLAAYPVKGAYVTLRLNDDQDRPVETVDMTGDLQVLESGQRVVLVGEFEVSAARPRIVEETLVLRSNDSIFFTLYSYNELKESPGFLSQLAKVLPFLEYRDLWTDPSSDWSSYETQFRYDRVLKD
jgi:hypothetical protein